GQGHRPRRPNGECHPDAARRRRAAVRDEGTAGGAGRPAELRPAGASVRASTGRMSPPRPTLEVGYVARVHGLKGELAVRTFDPDSEALSSVRRIVLRLRSGEERD